MNELRLLTMSEAATALKLNPQTVRRWLREGRLRGVRTGEGTGTIWRVPESALQSAFQESQAPDNPKAT